MKLSMNTKLIATLGIALGFLFFVGCEMTPEQKAALDAQLKGSSNDSEEIENKDTKDSKKKGDKNDDDSSNGCGNTEQSCFSERFVQPAVEVSKKVDILFVTDTSGSLDEERG